MKVGLELMSDRGPFFADAEVAELPNGDLFVGQLRVGFPDDACTEAEQNRFTEVRGEEIRARLAQEWQRLNGRVVMNMQTVARGNFKVRC